MNIKEIIEINGERDELIKRIKTDFTILTNETIIEVNDYINDKVIYQLETKDNKVIKTARNEDLLNDYFKEVIIGIVNKKYIGKLKFYVGDSLYAQIDPVENYMKTVLGTDQLNNAREKAVKYITSTYRYNGSKFLADSMIQEMNITKFDYENLFFTYIAWLNTGDKEIPDFKRITDPYTASLIRSDAKKMVADIFRRNDRALMYIYANDLGLNKYAYVGGTSEKTRQFCKDRIGKVFTHDEVLSWSDLEWPEKEPFKYNPFLDCGGFNCQHVLLPVDDNVTIDKRSKTWQRIKGEIWGYC